MTVETIQLLQNNILTITFEKEFLQLCTLTFLRYPLPTFIIQKDHTSKLMTASKCVCRTAIWAALNTKPFKCPVSWWPTPYSLQTSTCRNFFFTRQFNDNYCLPIKATSFQFCSRSHPLSPPFIFIFNPRHFLRQIKFNVQIQIFSLHSFRIQFHQVVCYVLCVYI